MPLRLGLPVTLSLLLSTVAHADLSISNKPTQNMDCQAGVCTATAKNAVLNVGDLTTMLGSGDVAVKTGTFAKDIEMLPMHPALTPWRNRTMLLWTEHIFRRQLERNST